MTKVEMIILFVKGK